MGAYLSEPLTEKESTDEHNERLSCAASSMQGWRVKQEDAHNVILDFDVNSSLFAVYDGHGGAEVAKYCAQKLPQFIKYTEGYKSGDYTQALENAFLDIDETMTHPYIVQTLKTLSGADAIPDEGSEAVTDDGSDEEENVHNLYEESRMPLEELIARYQNEVNSYVSHFKNEDKSGKSLSMRLKRRNIPNDGAGSSSSSNCINEPVEPEVSSSTGSSSSSSNLPKSDPEVSTTNGDHSLPESPSISSTNDIDDATITSNDNETPPKESIKATAEVLKSDDSAKPPKAEIICEKSNSNDKEIKDNNDESDDKNIEESKDKNNEESKDKNNEESKDINKEESKDKNKEESKDKNIEDSKDNSENKSEASETKDAENNSSSTTDEPVAEQSNSSTTKKRSAGVYNNFLGMIIDDGDYESDSNDETFESKEDGSSSEDEATVNGVNGDSSEDEEDSSEEDDDMNFSMRIKNEPGSNSGCTAVVALLNGDKLYVANAGDSRCVVCRNGKAVDMSIDHKPEDDIELERIIKAGGKVSKDGRVNGGLNLSRAIGDLGYKQNKALGVKEQMITAFPDVKTLTIDPETDTFMVLACDGIWNFMSSQSVVSFVSERLAEGREKLSQICEEMFDHCLAPNTLGDGTGCDNMTAVIVVFKSSQKENAESEVAPKKRLCSNDDGDKDVDSNQADHEETPAKRLKTDGETSSVSSSA